MKNSKVSVIIPNWNGKKLLAICLSSLEKQSFVNFETIVVDNGSKDDSVNYVKKKFDWVKTIETGANLGFPKAVNLGIKASSGEYVVLLNNDVRLEKNWLKNLVKALKENPDIGFATSKMIDFYNHNILDGVGDGYSIYGKPYKRGFNETDLGQYQKTVEVFGACGGAAIYRKKLFKKVGYFDDSFFAYLEDIDWSFRAQLLGYKCLYIYDSIVYHMGHASFKKKPNSFSQRLIARNTINVWFKNIPFLLGCKYFLYFFYHICRTLYSALRSKHFFATFFGYFQAFFAIPWRFIQNIDINNKRKITLNELENKLYKKYPKY